MEDWNDATSALAPGRLSSTCGLAGLLSPGDLLPGVWLHNSTGRHQRAAPGAAGARHGARPALGLSVPWQADEHPLTVITDRKNAFIKVAACSFFSKIGTLKLQHFTYLLFQQLNPYDLKLCSSLKLFWISA